MQIFSYLYNKVLAWSKHRYAPYYLAGMSVAESSFFPVPPDIMLVSMSLAKPERAWFYALLTTVCSVIGGIIGYMLGLFFFQWVEPYVIQYGYEQACLTASQWFAEWGFWAVFLAGFTPIPYKIFTISAGVIAMSFPLFVIASLIGRGARFFLVTAIIRFYGQRINQAMQQYVDRLGWLMLILIVAVFFLQGCGNSNYAPVADANHQPTRYMSEHVVQRGDTLYSIAWRYDLDYRDLARLNRIPAPYTLAIKQVIYLKIPPNSKAKAAVAKKPPVTERKTTTALSKSQGQWMWPAKGTVIARFSQTQGRKGIDITAARGSPVKATLDGRVAYAGSGLRGYGNLLIIKHNNDYLSAYAHNNKLLVKEGDNVKAGQKIAEMGSTDTDRVKLHFEIRKAGKPVNPESYLRKNAVS